MLAIVLGLLTVLGLLLNGSWDLWAQSLLFLAVLGAAALWLCGRLLAGFVPLPPGRLLAWTAGLAAWGGVSAYAGPLPAYAAPAWHVWLAALGAILAVSVMPEGQRRLLDRGIRAAAWFLAAVAVYQRFGLGMERPCASLLNPNAFAGAILLLLPLAVDQKDWLLAGGLLLCLSWTRSVGAWLGLAAALLLLRRRSALWTAVGAGTGCVCLAVIFAKLDAPDALNRWHWWLAAARMGWARPWFGFGPGTYAYVLPAYAATGRPLGTLFAHQHFLETAAEMGLPYLLAWLTGLFFLLRRGPTAKRVGAVAVLVQSLWDYALSIPAILWLFCCQAASSIQESGHGANIPARWRLPGCVLVLAVTWGAGTAVWQRWQAERLRVEAEGILRSAGPSPSALDFLERSARLCGHPETARLSGQIEAALARQPGGKGRILAAAADLERAVAQNPYRASTWTMLETVYRQMGRGDLARAARRRGAASCPGLRGP